jgi:hypothetical protein
MEMPVCYDDDDEFVVGLDKRTTDSIMKRIADYLAAHGALPCSISTTVDEWRVLGMGLPIAHIDLETAYGVVEVLPPAN